MVPIEYKSKNYEGMEWNTKIYVNIYRLSMWQVMYRLCHYTQLDDTYTWLLIKLKQDKNSDEVYIKDEKGR